MKNLKLALIVLISFTLGYVVRMAVHPKPEENKEIVLEPIDKDQAQVLVNNYTGQPKYLTLSSEINNAIISAGEANPSVDGFVLYYAADKGGEIANQTLVAGTARGVVITEYYPTVPAERGPVVDVCPIHCDILNGLEVDTSPDTPDSGDTSDTVEVDSADGL